MYGGLIFYQLKTHTHLFEGAEEDDDDPPILGFWGAMVWCAVMTILIAFLSEFTMAVIEEAAVVYTCPCHCVIMSALLVLLLLLLDLPCGFLFTSITLS